MDCNDCIIAVIIITACFGSSFFAIFWMIYATETDPKYQNMCFLKHCLHTIAIVTRHYLSSLEKIFQK